MCEYQFCVFSIFNVGVYRLYRVMLCIQSSPERYIFVIIIVPFCYISSALLDFLLVR